MHQFATYTFRSKSDSLSIILGQRLSNYEMPLPSFLTYRSNISTLSNRANNDAHQMSTMILYHKKNRELGPLYPGRICNHTKRRKGFVLADKENGWISKNNDAL